MYSCTLCLGWFNILCLNPDLKHQLYAFPNIWCIPCQTRLSVSVSVCSYIPDDSITDPASVERLILCCGQIYYDLHAERDRIKSEEHGPDNPGKRLLLVLFILLLLLFVLLLLLVHLLLLRLRMLQQIGSGCCMLGLLTGDLAFSFIVSCSIRASSFSLTL